MGDLSIVYWQNFWYVYIYLENFMNNSLWSDEVTKSSRASVAHQVSNFSFRYLSGQLDTCEVIGCLLP